MANDGDRPNYATTCVLLACPTTIPAQRTSVVLGAPCRISKTVLLIVEIAPPNQEPIKNHPLTRGNPVYGAFCDHDYCGVDAAGPGDSGHY